MEWKGKKITEWSQKVIDAYFFLSILGISLLSVFSTITCELEKEKNNNNNMLSFNSITKLIILMSNQFMQIILIVSWYMSQQSTTPTYTTTCTEKRKRTFSVKRKGREKTQKLKRDPQCQLVRNLTWIHYSGLTILIRIRLNTKFSTMVNKYTNTCICFK